MNWKRFYITYILGWLFIWQFSHVPLFAEYAIEYVHQFEHKLQGVMMKSSRLEDFKRELLKPVKKE